MPKGFSESISGYSSLRREESAGCYSEEQQLAALLFFNLGHQRCEKAAQDAFRREEQNCSLALLCSAFIGSCGKEALLFLS